MERRSSIRLDPLHRRPDEQSGLNMLAVCHHFELSGGTHPITVWALCPGYAATNLAGEAVRADKIKQGVAGSAEVSSQTLLGIVGGKRDGAYPSQLMSCA